MGYNETFAAENVEKKDKQAEEIKQEKVSFETEVNKVLEHPALFNNSFKANEFITKIEKTFKNHNRTLMRILGDITDNKQSDIYECLSIEGDKFSVLLSILIQNAHHKKNNVRSEAVVNGTYLDLQNENAAKGYLHS
jgi:hypothetical protein